MVLAKSLPLPLTKPSATGHTNTLALPLSRPLGQLPNPPVLTVSAPTGIHYVPAVTTLLCRSDKGKSAPIIGLNGFDFGVGIVLMSAYNVGHTPLPVLVANARTNYETDKPLQNRRYANTSMLGRLITADTVMTGLPKRLRRCPKVATSPALLIKTCSKEQTTLATLKKGCAESKTSPTVLFSALDNVGYEKALRPACQWVAIPVPEPEKPFDPNPCGNPPPASRLPLTLREKAHTHALMLPLPLACKYKPTIPLLSTYMIYNTITATLGGQPVGLIAPSINTSMDTFCWQLSSEITYEDFKQFNLATRTDKPVLSLTINGIRWDVQIEAYNDSQAFINNRCTINGRSQTAQLGGSAVMRSPAVILASLNARQIIDKQLHLLPFTLESYDATDWLVPGGTYTQSGSPIDTVIDVAKAGGNFVQSHRFNPTLAIKKRWSVAAWQVKDQSPTLILPANVVLSMDGNRRQNMRYNGIYVVGNAQNGIGGKIYRQTTNQTPEAPSLTHPLYTHTDALRSAGIAALSDSGEHTPYTVKTLLSTKYNVRLAELGEICEITGAQGNIKGVVTGISINVGVNNHAPEVTQTILIDCYTGD